MIDPDRRRLGREQSSIGILPVGARGRRHENRLEAYAIAPVSKIAFRKIHWGAPQPRSISFGAPIWEALPPPLTARRGE